jgi:tRNA(Arg) A34 adenosine deaminase TadA
MLHNLSNNEQSFINHALNEALKSPVLMRHGAVAVANGKIMGRGHNHYRS